MKAEDVTAMAETGESDVRTLAELRSRIDAIDEAMHLLLIERGGVIDALIKAKGTDRPGAAFRPQREAEMMRRIVARHTGRLPLMTVEHLWREIITTFTRIQAPFRVVVDTAVARAELHDLARFTFGFSVGLVEAKGAGAVIAAVVATGTDLGLIAQEQPAATGPWWRALAASAAPKIMAITPFIRAKERPADIPAFIISPPLADPASPDLRVMTGVTDAATAERLRRLAGVAVLAEAATHDRLTDMLVAVVPQVSDAALTAAGLAELVQVGGIARGIALDCAGDTLRQPPASRSAA